MEKESFFSIARDEVRSYYNIMFTNTWPVWIGSVLIAILALFIFLWKAPWGIAGGYLNSGSWLYYGLGLVEKKPSLPWLHPNFISTFGLFIGALASALIGRQFRIRRASGIEYCKGLIGGSLMGAGAALSGGCNVGGFFTAVAMFSIGGFFMWLGLILGAYVGLRILVWEIEKFPQKQANNSFEQTLTPMGKCWHSMKPFIGGILIIIMLLQLYVAARFDMTSQSVLCVLGLIIGFTMHRTRFCFAGAFRDPFMTGDNRMIKAVVISLIIYCFGSALIKWNYLQPEIMGVHHIWPGSLFGGFMFGIGMLLAGGCASSTLWRLAEGNTKYIVAAISFCLINPIVTLMWKKNDPSQLFGKAVYLPETLGWGVSIPLLLVFFTLWILLSVWNQKTDRLVL